MLNNQRVHLDFHPCEESVDPNQRLRMGVVLLPAAALAEARNIFNILDGLKISWFHCPMDWSFSFIFRYHLII